MIHASTCQLAPSSEGARPRERAEKPPPSSPADQTPTRGGARRPWAPGQETESEEIESHSEYEGFCSQSIEQGATPAPHVKTNGTEITIPEYREDVRCTFA